MSHDEYVADTFTVGELTVKIIQDTDAPNPRKENENVGTMVCWHRNYDLGDEQRGRDTSELDFFKELVFEVHPELEDYFENGLWKKIVTWDSGDDLKLYDAQKDKYTEAVREIIGKILHKYYVMLPLGLYDHSGISMYVGSQPHWSDAAGWDSGQVGWIYCTMKKAQEEWGDHPKSHEHYGVLGDPDAARKCAEKYLKGEVETYDQYLTGDVYGFVIEDEDGNDIDSCWGFFGDDYCKQEAKAVAESEWERIQAERREAEETERQAIEWYPRMMAL